MNWDNFNALAEQEDIERNVKALRRMQRYEHEENVRACYGLPPKTTNSSRDYEERLRAHWAQFEEIILVESDNEIGARLSNLFSGTLDCSVQLMLQILQTDEQSAEVFSVTNSIAPGKRPERLFPRRCAVSWESLRGRLALISGRHTRAVATAPLGNERPLPIPELIEIFTGFGIHCIGYDPNPDMIEKMNNAGALACIRQVAGSAFRDAFQAFELATGQIYASSHTAPH